MKCKGECNKQGEQCGEEACGCYCTRKAKHKGQHIACGEGRTHDIYAWEQKEQEHDK